MFRKTLGVSVLLLALFIGVFSQSVSAKEESIGKAYLELTANMEAELGRELNEEEKSTLSEAGWEIVDGSKVQITRPAQIGELRIDGQTTTVNDGVFNVEGSPETIEVIVSGETQLIERNSNGEYILTLKENWNALWEEMDEHMDENMHDMKPTPDNFYSTLGIVTTKPYGSKYYKGDNVHCNRFNGPATDDVHYAKSGWSAVKAARNFVGSDCDLALLAWRKCDSHNWCNISGNGDAAACSTKIGHSTKYHSHNPFSSER